MKKILLVIAIALAVFSTVIFIGYYIQKIAIADLDKTGSAEYKQHADAIGGINEQWLVIKAKMEAEGDNSKNIELAKKDFIEAISSTIFLKMQFESSLSDIEKKSLLRKLQQLSTDNKTFSNKNDGCEYTEQESPLQDFFVGSTLKFKKPMVYLDWKEEKENYCSPALSLAKFFLYSVESWDDIIFDKSNIVEHPIDPSTTFIVEKRILVNRGGLFDSEREHYVLRDSTGIISAPSMLVFDQDFYGEIGKSGSELYRGDDYIGHVVANIASSSVWIQEEKIEKADSISPKALDDYNIKDTNSVYQEEVKTESINLNENKKIESTDLNVPDINSPPKILTSKYFKDNNNAYYDQKIIEGADLDTFMIMSDYYAKDKNKAYCFGKTIENVDLHSFEILTDYYAKDKNKVYCFGKTIENVDLHSFEILTDDYAKDKNKVYREGNIIEGADLNSFKVLNWEYSMDKSNIYQFGKKLEGADPHSFEVLINEHFSKDRNNVYYFGEKIENANSNTFIALAYDYAKDKNNVYYEGKIIEGADSNTFIILEYGYARDRSNVYKKGIKIDSADPNTFDVHTYIAN